MSTDIFPLEVWPEGILQARIPANDNSLRVEVLERRAISTLSTPPGSPSEGDQHVLGSSPTGAWSAFSQHDVVIYTAGTWLAFAPFNGWLKVIGSTLSIYDGSAWSVFTGSASRSPSVQSVTSASTVTPTFSNDLVKITAQAAALALANPTGTAIDGLGMVIRIKDDGTARAITYGTQYRGIGVTLPTTTVVGKTLYLAMIYNTEDTKWDVVAVGQET
ncbi:MAG TPA: DUF2793 domain-containing protein [Hyphomicrobiaceae bacterium]|nr:DUF2793 domain-containing protein [Hyphomicrobiaceae bacterium]